METTHFSLPVMAQRLDLEHWASRLQSFADLSYAVGCGVKVEKRLWVKTNGTILG